MVNMKSKKNRALDLWRKQNGQCHWCRCNMLKPGSWKPGGLYDRGTPDNLCTIDHLDHKSSSLRGKFPGLKRTVAACWKCNNERGAKDEFHARLTVKDKHGSPVNKSGA